MAAQVARRRHGRDDRRCSRWHLYHIDPGASAVHLAHSQAKVFVYQTPEIGTLSSRIDELPLAACHFDAALSPSMIVCDIVFFFPCADSAMQSIVDDAIEGYSPMTSRP